MLTRKVYVSLMVAALGTYVLHSLLRPSDAARVANTRVFICAETGRPFDHRLVVGETTPVVSPFTGRPTGFPAEPCYWRPDGTVKPEPDHVLLNVYAGKPDEPTFCPDCGRLVVPLNPAPVAGRAPPTEAEYAARPAAYRDEEHGR